MSAAYANSLADCLKASWTGNTAWFQNKTKINGVDFYIATSTDAAAGNLYESKVYRTLAASQLCVEISEILHTSNMSNYPSATEANRQSIWNQLHAITESFKFD